MGLKDKLRRATVGKLKDTKKQKVTINEAEFEVRPYTLLERDRILEKSRTNDKEEKIQPLELQIYSIIECVYVPDTDEKVYEDTDYDMLASDVSNGYVDKLWSVVQDINFEDVDKAKKP